jgi:hypothetical protein
MKVIEREEEVTKIRYFAAVEEMRRGKNRKDRNKRNVATVIVADDHKPCEKKQ